MIECPICHINNDDQAHFCTECGHRFPAPSIANSPPQAPVPANPQPSITDRPNISPVVSQSSSSFNSSNSSNSSPSAPSTPSSASTNSTYMDNNNQKPGQPNSPNQGNQDPPQPKRQRLHSPMLGGDDPDDDAYAQNNYEAPKAPKAKGGLLRSPLLGGGNAGFEEEIEPARPAKGFKPASKPSHLRSPLLGGSADDEDDYEEDFPLRDKHSDKSSFPHRSSRPLVNAPEQTPGSHTGGRPHLRSPLLEGDDEFEEGDNFSKNNYQNQAPAAPAPPAGRPAKLHSPLFGKQNGVYDYMDDEEQAPSVNDNPNALRSPLLAARSPMPQDSPRNPNSAPPKPIVQQPMQQQPAPLAQPASLPPFPNPRPMSTQPPAIGTPLPMTPAITSDLNPDDASDSDGQDPFAWRDRGFPNAAPSAGAGFAAPNPMPAYGAPGMPQPAAPFPNPSGFAMPTAPEPVVNTPVKSMPLPTPAPVAKLEPKLKSKLLSGSGDSYNDDYEDDYKSAPQTGRKRFGDDSHQSGGFQGHSNASGSAPSGPIMVIAIPVALAALGKAYYLFALAQSNQLFSSPPFLADEIGQMTVLIGLLVYGLIGNKR